jgi:amidase
VFETKKLTVRELVLLFLKRIAEIDSGENGLHSVLEINPDALFIADILDKKLANNEPIGSLFGIPVLVKDNINTADRMHTSAGSVALKNIFAPYDATVIKKLREADAVILGKANMTEFANFITDGEMPDGYSSRGGQVINPFIRGKTPSGSSSGSAVAVAAGLCTVALGTETCGSIVSPAGQNGIVGIKPTIGLVSRNGIIPISYTCDTAGPIARTVEDAAILLDVISGGDENDLSTISQPEVKCSAALNECRLSGVKIGIYHPDGETINVEHKAQFISFCEKLKDNGVTIIDNIEVNHDFNMWHLTKHEFKSAMNCYLSTLGAETQIKTLTDIIHYNEAHAAIALKYGQKTFHNIEINSTGTMTETEYLQCLLRREKIIEDFDKTFDQYGIDIVLCRTFNNIIAPYAGFPSMILPIGQRSDKQPIDCYLMARRFHERTLVRIARAIEKVMNVTVRPEIE